VVELSIGELAARTGVAVATLRTWEARHGFPAPSRTPSRRRLYTEDDADAVERIVAHREAGLALDAAIDRVQRALEQRAPSVFATVQSTEPGLLAHQIPKRALVAMSCAVEDEYLARAEAGVVLGSFQHERFYRRSELRWQELSRGADVAAVFAAFPLSSSSSRRGSTAPREVPVEASSPMLREWAIVCAGPSFAACLVAWERPANRARNEGERTFEAVWTTRPATVLQAVTTFADLSRRPSPDVAQRLERWVDRSEIAAGEWGTTAGALGNRMVAYVVATAAWSR